MAPDHTGLAPFSASSPGAAGSLFMISGYKALSHDGYSISSSFSPADGKTPAFDENSYGLTIAGRMDGSELLGAAPHSVTLGVLANYTHTDIEVDAPGGGKGGSANIDSWSVGGYGLVTNGEKYGLVTVVGTFGSPTTKSDFVIPAKAEFSNFGVATSAVAGVLLPVGGSTKLDLRGGLNYIYAESEDYRDSFGTQYSDGHTEEFSGSVSARLFSIMHFDGYNIRPFVQSGLTYRFLYENELKINSETFSFDDADTSVFARAGFDFDIGRSTQAYLAVRGDASEDMRAIAAQVGVTFKLD
jgi:outer membrane autotransporter protein